MGCVNNQLTTGGSTYCVGLQGKFPETFKAYPYGYQLGKQITLMDAR